MLDCNYIVLYVTDPNESARFYGELFNREVTISSENFSVFTLPSGMQIGLYRRSMVEPSLHGNESQCELCIVLENNQSVDSLHQVWLSQNTKILKAPFDACFAYTFIAADPDGHRIRVCNPKEKSDS